MVVLVPGRNASSFDDEITAEVTEALPLLTVFAPVPEAPRRSSAWPLALADTAPVTEIVP